ncbi:MAG: glycosyltransferase family 4 protein [Solirubrobacterales bacterium]
MRVAMLLENNPYPQDVRVRSEAESLVEAGHEVTVIAPRAPGQSRHESIGAVRVRRFRLPETPASALGFVVEYGIANAQLYLGALRALLTGAEVLHLHNPPDTLFGVAFLARAMGRRAVFDHHDLAPELFEAKFGPSRVAALLRLFERLTFSSADLVLAANESHRKIALERGRKDSSEVVVVRNGPPSKALEQATEPRLGPLEDPHLLFLGSMESQDGVDSLLSVLGDLQRDHGIDRARLTFVGEGSRRGPIEAAALTAGLGDRVAFTGLIPHAEVPTHLAAADICIDPAPCTELNQRSTMIKIAEYMAARRAVVAYPLVETQRTAGDAIAYGRCDDQASLVGEIAGLARDPDRRLDLAERGYERARELTWDASAAELRAAYGKLRSAG